MNYLITFFLFLFIAFSPCIAAEAQQTDAKNTPASPVAKIKMENDDNKPGQTVKEYSETPGYDIDGSTSASKLAAQRSHSVSKSDETGLAIFLGVIVIGLIVFFLKPFSDNK